jgi:alkylhydroperoxidase family enzyme
MSRLQPPDPSTLKPDAQAVWNRISSARGSTATMRGPSSVMMHVPTLAERQFDFEHYFYTDDADLPAADRELVILATVREWDARFAWARHEVRAREANTRPEAIEVLRKKGSLQGLTPREALLTELTQTLLRTQEVPDPLYQRAVDELGTKQLVEVVGLIGNYCSRGLYIKVFDIQEESPTF